MGVIEDMLNALDRIPGWKRINGLPTEVDELKQRLAALEERLSPAKGDSCPKCRAMSFTLEKRFR